MEVPLLSFSTQFSRRIKEPSEKEKGSENPVQGEGRLLLTKKKYQEGSKEEQHEKPRTHLTLKIREGFMIIIAVPVSVSCSLTKMVLMCSHTHEAHEVHRHSRHKHHVSAMNVYHLTQR